MVRQKDLTIDDNIYLYINRTRNRKKREVHEKFISQITKGGLRTDVVSSSALLDNGRSRRMCRNERKNENGEKKNRAREKKREKGSRRDV